MAAADAPPPEGSGAVLERKAFLRSVTGQSVLTLISRVLGLVREQLRALFLGTGTSSDAFGLALMLPNLFRRLLGEGQMTAAFLPTLVERIRTGDREHVRRFFSDFLGVFTFIITLVVVLGYLGVPWVVGTFFSETGDPGLTVRLTQVLFPFLGLVTVAALLQAALQAHHLFWPGAATPILLNLAVIGCAWLLHDAFPDPSYAFAVGFLIGGLLQVVFQVPFILRRGLSLRPRLGFRNPHVRRVLKIFVPGVFAGGIYQINVFVSQMVASGLPEGRISALQYSVRLQELVLGVFVVSITTVILPTLSAQMADEGSSSRSAAHTLGISGRALAMVTIPATVGLILLGPPLIRLLFQFGAFDPHSTDLVFTALLYHALGIFPIALARNITQAFYAQKDLKTPTLVAAVVLVVHLALCFALAGPMDHGGIALAGTLGAVLTVALLIPALHRRGIPVINRRFLVSTGRVLVASAAMGVVVWALARAFDLHDPTTSRVRIALGIGVCTSAGLVVVLLALLALRHREARGLVRGLKRRLLRRGRT